jgi:DNA mismatch repair ATPase MutS
VKVLLMYNDRDFNPKELTLPTNEQSLTQDLELNTLFYAMSLGDNYLYDVAKSAVLSGFDNDVETVQYRQEILKDCLKNASVIRTLYQIPIEAILNKRKHWLGISGISPRGILNSAVAMLQMFVSLLKKLKDITDQCADDFESEGFNRFFSMIKKELNDDYFESLQNYLKELKFRDGVLISAELGRGNEGIDHILRKPLDNQQNWVKRVFSQKSPVYSFSIHPRDDYGARALSEFTDKGINQVANALAQSADHINDFFNVLRTELAFYIGSLNLYEQLIEMENPITFPHAVASNERRHTFQGLYDVCLALTKKQKIVGTSVCADSKDLILITGANQGGKSTFLRSIGLSQLMMQCGMFVPAEAFSANLCKGLFTHYKRKEDATMKSGKLDEELARISQIADQITSNSLILFNESFAATNEREGSEIARQITTALLEKNIKVFFVTHLYEFAHGFYEKQLGNACFLRAERRTDGKRTFKIVEGKPLQTSYGEDVYEKIFIH